MKSAPDLTPAQAPIVIEPTHTNGTVETVSAEFAVIWLHGLGADGHDFESVVPQLALPQNHHIRFVFPTAPIQAVTVNLGEYRTAWYDIQSIQLLEHIDWEGILWSVDYIHQLIEAQKATGLKTEQILLAGFSQGGVIAQHAVLSYSEPLAGVMVLSSYFPLMSGYDWVKQSVSLPVMLAHGTEDSLCPIKNAQLALASWQNLGFNPQWHEYRMQHEVCADEIKHMSHFLKHCFSLV